MNIEINKSLSSHTTLHLPAKAAHFVEIFSTEELKNFLTTSYTQPLYILGGGSNVLFLNDFNGTILHISIQGKEVISENDKEIIIKVSAGENWHKFVQWTLQNQWGGLENLSLIPGRVGASPIQNIGAYGVEVKDCITSVEAMEIATGKTVSFTNSECEFGYRDSIFKRHAKGKYIITAVSFRLQKQGYHTLHLGYGAILSELEKLNIEQPSIQDVSQAVISIRQSKLPDPGECPNTGSFFKNPVISTDLFLELKKSYPEIPGYTMSETETKVPAGWLIEQSGWKGKRTGNVGVHDKQALILINPGHGTGQEVYDLSCTIIREVEEKFGITLEREVNVIE